LHHRKPTGYRYTDYLRGIALNLCM
jgi:hypothetical protein